MAAAVLRLEPPGIFFRGAQPVLPEAVATPPPSTGAHVQELLRLWGLRFDLLRARRAEGDGPREPIVRQSLQLAERVRAEQRSLRARTAAAKLAGVGLPLLLLEERLGLGERELEVLTALLAVELDPRLLSRLSDTPPLFLTPDVLCELLGGDGVSDRAVWTPLFCGEDSLLERRVVLRADERTLVLPLFATPLRLNPRVLCFLVGLEGEGEDPLLSGLLQRTEPAPATLCPPELFGLLDGPPGYVLWLVGPPKLGSRELAAALAAAHGRSMTEVDMEGLGTERPAELSRALSALRLEVLLEQTVLLVTLGGPVQEVEQRQGLLRALRQLGRRAAGPIIFLSEQATAPLMPILGGARCYPLPPLGPEARLRLWESGLAASGIALASAQRQSLAEEFALGPGEIEDVLLSVSRARGDQSVADHGLLRQACIQRLSRRLHQLAEVVVTSFEWDDLLLPEEELQLLEEMIVYQRHRRQVLSEWNLASKLPYGNGIAALFSGPPGTGKTMAASVIANALGRELHRVDLSRVVDKYIGETEKNLGAVFAAAADAHAVLLFDEADSLFARRTAVSSSHDRYANLETNFLLQRIEQHPGITILTTNNRKSIDDAFLRRIQFKVEFPFPQESERARIWHGSVTRELPLAGPIDWEVLGQRYELTGGHIRSAVLRAAYWAASSRSAVTEEMLHAAAIVECQGLGMLVQSAGERDGEPGLDGVA